MSEAAHDLGRGRWVALAILLIAGFMNLIDVTIVNVAIPTLQDSFDASESEIEWVVAIYTLTYALGLLPCGRLGDRVGRRRMFVAGVTVFTAGSALCGLAPSVETLIAARVVQGVGGAMMTPQTLALVPSIFPPDERGFVFSFFGLAAGLATVIGPVLGGTLIRADLFGLDWRPIFLVNIPVGAIAVFAALRFIPHMPGTGGAGNDPIGIALVGGTLLLVLFPLVEGRALGWPWWCFAMIAAAVPAGFVFVRWQYRQDRLDRPQVLPVELLSSKRFLIGVSMIGVLFSGVPGFFFVFAQYLQNGFGFTAFESGLTTMPFSVGVLLASFISGWFGSRWPRHRVVFGTSCLVIGMLSLRWLALGMPGTVDPVPMIVPLFVGGLGLGLTVAPLFDTVMAALPSSIAGSASGTLQAFQQVGGAFGIALMGFVFYAALQAGVAPDVPIREAASDAYMQGLGNAMIYNSLAFAGVALLLLALPRSSDSDPESDTPGRAAPKAEEQAA